MPPSFVCLAQSRQTMGHTVMGVRVLVVQVQALAIILQCQAEAGFAFQFRSVSIGFVPLFLIVRPQANAQLRSEWWAVFEIGRNSAQKNASAGSLAQCR